MGWDQLKVSDRGLYGCLPLAKKGGSVEEYCSECLRGGSGRKRSQSDSSCVVRGFQRKRRLEQGERWKKTAGRAGGSGRKHRHYGKRKRSPASSSRRYQWTANRINGAWGFDAEWRRSGGEERSNLCGESRREEGSEAATKNKIKIRGGSSTKSAHSLKRRKRGGADKERTG